MIKVFNTVIKKVQDEKLNVRLGLVEYQGKSNDFEFDAKYSCPLTDNMGKIAKIANELKCGNEELLTFNAEVFCGLKMAIDDSKWSDDNKQIILLCASSNKDIIFKEPNTSDCDIKTEEQMKKYLSKTDTNLFVVHKNYTTQTKQANSLRNFKVAYSEAVKELEQMGIDKSDIVSIEKEDDVANAADKVLEYIKDNISDKASSDSDNDVTESSETSTKSDDASDSDSVPAKGKTAKKSKVKAKSEIKSDKDEADDEATDDEEDAKSESKDDSAASSVDFGPYVHGYIKMFDSEGVPLVKIQCFVTRESLEKISNSLYDAHRRMNSIMAGYGGNIRVLSNSLIIGTTEFLSGDNLEDVDFDEINVTAMETLPSDFTDGIYNEIPLLKASSSKIKDWQKRLNKWHSYTKELLSIDSDADWSKLPNGAEYKIIDLPGKK